MPRVQYGYKGVSMHNQYDMSRVQYGYKSVSMHKQYDMPNCAETSQTASTNTQRQVNATWP